MSGQSQSTDRTSGSDAPSPAPPVWRSLEAVLESVADEDVLLVNPSPSVFESVIHALSDHHGTTVRVLTTTTVVERVDAWFSLAAIAADLIEQERLSVRVAPNPPRNSLALTDDRAIALCSLDCDVVGIEAGADDLVAQLVATYAEAWATADAATLRTPPRSEMRETLADLFDDPMADDFDRLLESASTATGESLDGVTIGLLLAAAHEELFYDICEWGESLGLGSKSTFSRTRSRLEDADLVETEKVPINVGRPRKRLLLAADELRDAGTDELLSRANKRLVN